MLGGGPAGLTAGLVLAHRGVEGRVFEADGQVGGIAKTVERGGVPLRPRRPPVLHEARPGAAPLGADARATSSSSARGSRGSTTAASTSRTRSAPRTSCAASASIETLRCARLVHRGPAAPRRAPVTFEDWVTAPLRPPALQRVLPRVHREGLGDPGERDPGRVGGPADPQPVVLDRPDLRARPQADARDEPDRGVPLPAPRAGPDVGDARRRSPSGPGVPVELRHRVTACFATPRRRVTSVEVLGPDGEREVSRSTASSRASRSPSSSSRSTRCRRTTSSPRPAGSATGTCIVVGLVISATPSRSRTTGSTSTTPGRAPVASRTSARGARG